ncbi:MAG: TIGR00341 family protein [Maioricimonas sp. JB049]
MALRCMQIFIPEDSTSKAEEILDKREILGTWRDAADEDRVVLHILVDAEEAEPIMDQFDEAYAGSKKFRVVLLSVEAILPRPEAQESSEFGGDAANGHAKNGVGEAGRVSREELYHDITDSLGVNRIFIAMTVLASIVAAVGLMRDDVAVIIGAMVIAPLLAPNVALSLAVTLGDLKLMRTALWANTVGLSLTLLVSIAVGFYFEVDPEVQAIGSRTNLGLGDLALALAAGSAGTFAFTRGLSGAVIGVMVAVALMPPMVVFGMLLGDGEQYRAMGALVLVGANIVCINLAGVTTFLLQGLRPRTWYEEERARTATRIAIAAAVVMLLALVLILSTTDLLDSLD